VRKAILARVLEQVVDERGGIDDLNMRVWQSRD
jgi:hypothetical protein